MVNNASALDRKSSFVKELTRCLAAQLTKAMQNALQAWTIALVMTTPILSY